MITPQTRPDLPWQRLVGTIQTDKGPRFVNAPHVLWCIVPVRDASYLYAWSARNGAVFEWRCHTPHLHMLRIIEWAQQSG